MKRIIAQCIKEIAQFRRDRLTLALAFLLPFITLLIFGFAIRLESKDIPLIVQDFSHTNLSNSYIERLYATNQFIPKEWSGNDPITDAIDKGIAKVAVIIPPQFSQDIKAGKNTKIQVLIDGTDVNNARVIRGSIQQVNNFFMKEHKLLPKQSIITPKIRLWFNPGRIESLYIVPGVYGVILWNSPSLLAAVGMVREKEKGTIIQVYASSISATELLLGKGIAYLLIAILETLVVMILGSIIFQVGIVGNPMILILGTLIFLIDSVCFGLFLGVSSNNQNTAVQGAALIGFITSLLLSGFIYPLNNIPFPLSLTSNIIPTRYFIDITRDSFLRGTGFDGVWFDFVMLILLGVLFFNISLKLLSKMQIPS